jgi:hypothetical protein
MFTENEEDRSGGGMGGIIDWKSKEWSPGGSVSVPEEAKEVLKPDRDIS